MLTKTVRIREVDGKLYDVSLEEVSRVEVTQLNLLKEAFEETVASNPDMNTSELAEALVQQVSNNNLI